MSRVIAYISIGISPSPATDIKIGRVATVIFTVIVDVLPSKVDDDIKFRVKLR